MSRPVRAAHAVRLAALLCSLAAGSAATAQAPPAGLWRTPVRGGLVRIRPCGANLCGFVAGSPMLTAHPDQPDAHNHDPALRGRRIMGLKVLEVRPLSADRWGEGWAYDPDNGQTYHADVERTAPDVLRVRGCIVAPLCGVQVWTQAP